MSTHNDELAEFRIEATELLESAEKSLLLLEQGEDFKTHFDTLFRVFHNLKGASGMMGLLDLGQHMHQLENTLNGLQQVGAVSKEQIDGFLQGVDKARALLGIKGGDESAEEAAPVEEAAVIAAPVPEAKPISTEGITEFIIEALEITNRVGQYLSTAEKNGVSDELVDGIYREVHTLKGGANLFGQTDLGDLNHAVESVLDNLREHSIKPSKELMDGLFTALDTIEALIQACPEPAGPELKAKVKESILFFIGFHQAPQPDALKPEVEVPVASAPTTTVAASAPPPVEAISKAPTEADKEAGGTIRVPVQLLDKLMTLMGEMVLVRNQVMQYASSTEDLEFQNLSKRLNVITGEIQGEMMKTRMQPIGNVLSKFSRLVRELSKDLGKKIDMQLMGADTELDKTLLETVKDPLTHIVRNSCDHGIETLEERKAAGKSETGTIQINSFHEGGQVIIEITDDGKGLHPDKLLKKGIEKGLVTAERGAQMSEREIMHLIFAPGFSTAAKVTNVSGRGVGMDVVRTNIEKIGGTVEVESQAGRGTTMRLKIPLTLAIVPAMVVRCNNESFAIPQLNLVELVRVEKSSSEHKIEFIQGHPVYRLRGNILPLVHIRKVLEISDVDTLNQEVSNIIVLKSEHISFGLIVDEIQDTADIVVKPLARFLKSIGVFSGATVMGDGSIALILDVAGIVKSHLLNVGDLKKEAVDMQAGKVKVEDLQDFLLLKVGAAAKHAVLLGYVHRLEEFKKSQIEVSGKHRLVRYRNSVLPLISLNNALGLDEAAVGNSDVISVLVIEKGSNSYGLEVNEILDIMSTESRLDASLANESGIIGNLITDNEIVVVIDPYLVIQRVMGLEKVPNKASSGISHFSNIEISKPIKNILYVEDAAFFRSHVSRVLEAAGFNVTMANNGQDACDLLFNAPKESFDLLLSDIEMPKMNGFEFAKSVRKNADWQKIPMIALSTRADQKHVDEGFRSGFNAYLEKMNAEELIQSISEVSKKGAA
jgi:two-component system, chemotaxis family, sensor kinase CheA